MRDGAGEEGGVEVEVHSLREAEGECGDVVAVGAIADEAVEVRGVGFVGTAGFVDMMPRSEEAGESGHGGRFARGCWVFGFELGVLVF